MFGLPGSSGELAEPMSAHTVQLLQGERVLADDAAVEVELTAATILSASKALQAVQSFGNSLDQFLNEPFLNEQRRDYLMEVVSQEKIGRAHV